MKILTCVFWTIFRAPLSLDEDALSSDSLCESSSYATRPTEEMISSSVVVDDVQTHHAFSLLWPESRFGPNSDS